MTKVLLLVEGAKEEKRILEKVLEEYNIGFNVEIYSYKTNIYELYEKIFLGREDDLKSIKLIDFLRARDRETQFLQESFSDILLVFDYDAQDDRFSEERLELMLKFFNESTENGKLYINYPMVESYKHFKSYPEDIEYKDRKVNVEDIQNKKYKEIVSREAKITDIRKYKKKHFNSMIKQNIKKANYILNGNYNINEENMKTTYLNINPVQIAKKQNEAWKGNEAFLYVLNTCLFFVCDYKFKLILE